MSVLYVPAVMHDSGERVLKVFCGIQNAEFRKRVICELLIQNVVQITRYKHSAFHKHPTTAYSTSNCK